MDAKVTARGKPAASRLSRKDGEKIRRDKLNSLIAQLAEEVPTIRYAQRRPDKLAILRLTVSFLKLHQGLKKRKIVTQCLRSFGNLYGAATKASDGVIFIMTKSGTILYVSENIRSTLGFHQLDMIGFNIEKFIHSSDLETLTSQFMHDSVTLASFMEEQNPTALQRVEVHSRHQKSCYLRMLCATKKRQDEDSGEVAKNYEVMHFSSHMDSGNEGGEPWIVAFMKPLESPGMTEVEINVTQFTACNEFVSHHDLDGTILAVDHRGALFHGYMAVEVVGKSPYCMVLEEDLQSIALSHKLILKEDEIPMTVYRLKSLSGSHIYTQSKSVIVCDKWTKQPKCIVSVNTIHTDEDGKKLLMEQNRRIAEIQASTDSLSLIDHSEDSQKSYSSSGSSSDSTDSGFAQHGFTSENSAFSPGEDGNSLLYELYEKEAKTFPDKYSRLPAGDDSPFSISVKRRHDDESEESSSEHFTDCTTDLTSDHNGENLRNFVKSGEEDKLIREGKESAVDSIQNSDFKSNKCSQEKEGFAKKVTSIEQPILKGLLEGQLNWNDFVPVGKGQLQEFPTNETKKNDPVNVCCSFENLPASPSYSECSSSGPDLRMGTSDATDIIQLSAVASSDQQSNDFKSKFVEQLHSKHTQLQVTLSEQRSTLQYLRSRLQMGQESISLDLEETHAQKDLLGKILEAENLVTIQSGLLAEIQAELKSQEGDINININGCKRYR